MRFFLTLIFLMAGFISAEEIRKGTVTGSKLRMRAKPGTRYEVVGQLMKGDNVKVVEENNGWLKLVAPKSVSGWISNKYIDHGIITGDSVNVRAGANIAYTIIGKVNKGDKVEVLEIKKEVWAKIKAPASAHVWVSAAYVKLEPLMVARNDSENDILNEVKAVEEKEESKTNEELKDLEEQVAKEKLAAEEAKQKLAALMKEKEENEKELARLEEERKAAIDAKLAEEKKFLVITKILEELIKKRSTKIIVSIDENNQLFLGKQPISKEDLLAAYKATGNETVAFIKAAEKAAADVKQDIADALMKVNGKVFFEDPTNLLKNDHIILPEEMKKDTKLLQSSFITIQVKKDSSVIIGKVPTPNEYIEAVLLSYRENFGHSSVFIRSQENSDKYLLDELMTVVQNCKFKLINYPSLMSELKNAEEQIQKEELPELKDEVNEVLINTYTTEQALAPGRVKMIGYILQVRDSDKHLVDFALAARVNEEFYAIAYLKGRKKELQSFYLKEVEIVGVSKRLEGWTRPILYVEEFKPLSK
ncbi:MAG: SH3 domain-containing protein [Lentisphaerales bacterium]|nr:SH3 domain-containing protein [Lentisphaerales bacterium]